MTASPSPASPVSMELPEEIGRAIEALEIASHILGGNFVSMLDADEADRGACQAREALTAAILSRLREGEAALARVETLEWHLRECVNQLEYEHEKFGGTGSGETVLFRARSALSEASSQGDQ